MKELNVVKIMSAQGLDPKQIRIFIRNQTDEINRQWVNAMDLQLENAHLAIINGEAPAFYDEPEDEIKYREEELERAYECLEEHWLPQGIRAITAERLDMDMTPTFHSIFNYCVDKPEPTEYWYNGVFHSHTDRSW